MQPSAPPRSVLIVDDDEGLLLLMEDILQDAGFKVETAASGAVALEKLEKQPADLMLLDLKLKDTPGQNLLKRLKKANALVPFIVVTGQGDERVAVEMMKQGALDYLVKDAGILDRLGAVVSRALEQLDRDRAFTQVQAALKESEREILEVSEREQRRFGADLHDGLGQQLTAIELQCQSLKADLVVQNPDLVPQADLICQFLREAIAHTRSLSRGLSPVNLDSNGLTDALGELARRTASVARIDCRFECPTPILPAKSTVSTHLFRIAQEAVNNALKHAAAKAITIRLLQKDRILRLEIVDNGKGLPARRTSGEGIGLEVMKHRANVIGASLELKSKPGAGVAVVCLLPT